MNYKCVQLIFAIVALLFLGTSSLKAAEIDSCQTYTPETSTCKPYTENDLTSLKTGTNPALIMGASIVALASNPSSTLGQDLLNLSSRVEFPKGIATVSLILYQLNYNNQISVKPWRENIEQLSRDDKDNALSYYLLALLRGEDGAVRESVSLIKKGNTKTFNGYPKERFKAVVAAGETAQCEKIQAQRYALWNSFSTGVIMRTRKLCDKLIEIPDQEARNACFVMGNNLERSSITIIDKLQSLRIQRNALDPSADAKAVLDIKNRSERALTCDGKKPEEWIPYSEVNEETDLKYDEIYLASGECSALEFLSEYIKQKKQIK